MTPRRVRVALAALVLAGCSYRVEHGAMRADTVTVAESAHTPSASVTGVGPNFSGKGGIAVTVSNVPATYVVAFRWRGQKIAVDNRALWEAVVPGERVLVWWHPRWKVDKKTGRRERIADTRDGVTPLGMRPR